MAVPKDAEGRLIYRPDGDVLRAYIRDRSPVAIIRGPIGSGTSTASLFRIYATGMEQAPGPDGVRRTRWGIVRSTYPELLTSTIKTFNQWFPPHLYGEMKKSRPLNHVMRVGDMEIDWWFMALDGEDDVEKLRSTEFTGLFYNEVEFQDYEIFKEGRSRTGRFPSMADGGPTWYGVIGDMNAPSEEHWLVRMTGEAPYPDEVPEDKRMSWPAEWAYFVQPGAVIELTDATGKPTGEYVPNPKAENTKWLVKGYYENLSKGMTREWIRSRLMNQITFVIDGDPVWNNVDPDVHLSKVKLPYVAGREVVVALDFGRTRPAALIAQEIGNKVQCQCEFRMYNAGAEIFAPALKRFLEVNYRGARIKFVGDPKGRDKGAATERSAYDIFRAFGMIVEPAKVKNNDLSIRLGAVSFALQTNRLLIGPDCLTLRAALSGKYHFKRPDIGEPEPVKDKYSDIADCLQYLCVFLGEGRQMMGLEAVEAAHAVRARNAARVDLRRVR